MNSFHKVIYIIYKALIFNKFSCRNLIFPQTTFNSEISKIKTDLEKDPQRFNILSLKIIDEDKPTIFEKMSLKEEDYDSKNSENDLVVINLRLIDKIKISEIVKRCKYHVIFSESLYQIIDYIKNYKEMKIEIMKIFFLKNNDFEVKEYLILLKILN